MQQYIEALQLDMQYSAKEIAKHMARPTPLDWTTIKQVGRYLVGAPRYVHTFADSDWAGDKVTRKSTSGELIMLGKHMIKS